MQTKKVIYIAGYGRSGSTLLDSILSNIPRVEGLGEISNLFDALEKDENCSCGLSLKSCEHWQDIVTLTETYQLEHLSRAHRKIEGVHLARTDQKEIYTAFWKELIEIKFRDYDYLIDSSKISRMTLFRPLMLKKLGFDVKVIHLYKPTDLLLTSLLKGSNKTLDKGVTLTGWRLYLFIIKSFFGALLADFTTCIIGRFFIKDYMKLNFKDLQTSPSKTCNRILNFTDESCINFHSNEFDKGHGVSGNRMRKNGGNILLSKARELNNKPPIHFRILFSILRIFHQ